MLNGHEFSMSMSFHRFLSYLGFLSPLLRSQSPKSGHLRLKQQHTRTVPMRKRMKKTNAMTKVRTVKAPPAKSSSVVEEEEEQDPPP